MPTRRSGDIDSDGDLDLFIGLNSRVAFIENLGDANTPLFAAPTYNPFGLNPGVLTSLAVTLVDINGDDLLDLCMGEDSGNTFFFLNIGTAGAPAFDGGTFNAFGLTRVGPQAVPAFGDIDDDGDLDAFIGDASEVSYFENTGTRTVPIFAAAVTSPFNLLLGNISAVNLTLVDIDVDDDLDMLIGEIGGATVLFENEGTASAASFSQFALGGPFGLSNVGDFASPEFVDIDGDGDLDAFIGNENGEVFSYLNEVRSLPPATLTPAPTATPVPPTATPTSTPVAPTATSTLTPAVPTATATSTSVVPTATATSTSQIPTASATPDGPACVGDCDGSGEVTINELVRGVNIALENSTVDQCSAMDADGNGRVTINELIQAVRNALEGCA